GGQRRQPDRADPGILRRHRADQSERRGGTREARRAGLNTPDHRKPARTAESRPMSRFSPASPELLARRLAEFCGERHPGEHPLRVALDAPSCADLSRPARLLTAELRAAGRPVALVEASSFYRDASLRLEYGRADVESFYRGWLDTAA